MATNSAEKPDTENSSGEPVVNEWERNYVPRRMAHPKPRLTLRWLLAYMLSPLQPAPRVVESMQARTKKRPYQRQYLGRQSTRRRRRRLRRMYWLRFVKWSKRIAYSLLFSILAITILFWAKFAVVYNVPEYLQVGQFAQVQAYIVYKSWWFGPPIFDLEKYPILDPAHPEQSLVMQLQRYKDIVTDPFVVYVFMQHHE
ncbi:hypothetical protein [Sulfoacidibacillus thermotolerans]|uniref:Uncharacterized protein n=1 Tax=Sulfoacidibacillus thermotolerans TaxID=1765684 RepID=A0A2U3D6C3_SULT2|nr:hypothetical protein [Sulfoacidibacillus thermotolerans]PWI56831.1 hypothetical protein BM613_11805 [Sulfoacidibacillus thermotolerans]